MNKEFIDILNKGFSEYKYTVSDEQINKLELFNDLVMQTNEHTNLTAITGSIESAKKHFLDSVNPIAMTLMKNSESVIDIGSGAGFPGIPLAVLNPDVLFTLVDTRKKRCDFMEYAVEHLKLNNITIVWKRAEDLGKDITYREQYDLACARALAAMPTLLEYLVPFVKLGGYTMLYKGSMAQDELNSAQNAIDTLGMGEFTIAPYSVYEESSKYAMVYGTKIKPTPVKYPRKSGMASKRPL